MRLRFLGVPRDPDGTFLVNAPGWPGPIVAGQTVDIPDELGARILVDHAAVFDVLEEGPVHAAFEEPSSDKAVKSPKRKKSPTE